METSYSSHTHAPVNIFSVLAAFLYVIEIIKIPMAITFFFKSNFDYLFLWLLDLHTHMFNNNNAKSLKIFHLQTLNFIELRPFEEHTK